MCTTHSTGHLLKATHVFFCQEPTVLNCLRISHTLINFCQLCHILGGLFPHYKGHSDDTCDFVGEVERDSQILQNWVFHSL